MDSFLGFTLPTTDGDGDGDISSSGHKLVPWISWDDWRFVKDGLFSSSPDSIASALRRISSWRSRGCIPVTVEVTASIIEIQQKDPFFSNDISENVFHSEEMLAMLYSMAIMRLVNGVVEKTRKKMEVSIGQAAEELCIPRMLIDVRHECSHRELPSLRLVRLASVKALDWLKFYYWEPQTMAIQSDQTINVRKEIKSVLRELFLSLNVKQIQLPNTSVDKEKRVKYSNHLFGRSKILSLKARKISSKLAGPKKYINKLLKSFSRLYLSFSPEVVSVLLRLLLKASDSADLAELVKNHQISDSASSLQTALDDWKPVIIRLSDKEPHLLVTLLREILDIIETLELGNPHIENLKFVQPVSDVEQLSYLFEWLVSSCRGLKIILDKESAVKSSSSTGLDRSDTTLVEYLRRCLKLSSSGNNQLMNAALGIAHMTGNHTLIDKLNKLASINNVNRHDDHEILPSENYSQHEDSLREAAKKLEVFKRHHLKDIDVDLTTHGHARSKSAWVVAKSWNSCSIGMLPPGIGSSARLPVLDVDDCPEEARRPSEIKEFPELNRCDGKRRADSGLENLESSCYKKMKGSESDLKFDDKGDQLSIGGDQGWLIVDGVWKKIRDEDILAIASNIRILV